MKKLIAILPLILLLSSCKKETIDIEDEISESNLASILGSWEVTNSEMLPFGHISYCSNLSIGSIFKFGKDSTLKVYNTQNPNENCNKKQRFTLVENEIQIVELDMVFYYPVKEKAENKLTLLIPHLQYEASLNENFTKEQIANFYKNGFTITLQKIE